MIIVERGNTVAMESDLLCAELSKSQFDRISRIMHSTCGVNLQIGKEQLVKARLTRRLRALGLGCFEDYVKYLESGRDCGEMTQMIDSLTTNKTSFFRESSHFDFLCKDLLPKIVERGNKLRIWSAGCSSGEEPYTLGLLLCEEIPSIASFDARILATDISTRVLEKAGEAIYSQETVADVPGVMLTKYFDCVQSGPHRTYQVKQSVRSLVRLARLNLMDSWPMKGPFDAIFCRNVMIYFDKPTQQQLIKRFYDMLAPGGHLFVGHSESLTSAVHQFRYVQPAVYAK